MCGRFALFASELDLAAFFALDDDEAIKNLAPRYNIAPTQPVAAVCWDSASCKRRITLMRWGLIPSWSNDPAIGVRMSNARSETVREKSAFHDAFRQRRCLIPASGFFEWKRNGSQRSPWFFRLREGSLIAMAGLWERWRDPQRNPVDSLTILTMFANQTVAEVHDRMPVIVRPEDFERWLGQRSGSEADVTSLLRALPDEEMEKYPVSSVVNSPRNDTPLCVEPVRISGD